MHIASGAVGTYPLDAALLFDENFYIAANPDVAAAGIDPLGHYAAFGWLEGRDPNGLFDTEGHLFANPDVDAAGIDPLVRYALRGWLEGRDPSAVFDTEAYLLAYPDVAAAGVNPLEHYLHAGPRRAGSPSRTGSSADAARRKRRLAHAAFASPRYDG